MKYSNFASIIRAIREKGEGLDAIVYEGIAFIAREIIIDRKHGAGNQWKALREASPDYARKIIDTAQKACTALARSDRDEDDRLEVVLLSARDNLRGRRLKLKAAQMANREQAREEAEEAAEEARRERVARYEKQIGKKPGNPRAASAKTTPRTKASAMVHPYVLKGLQGSEVVSMELTEDEYAEALKAVTAYREAQHTLKLVEKMTGTNG